MAGDCQPAQARQGERTAIAPRLDDICTLARDLDGVARRARRRSAAMTDKLMEGFKAWLVLWLAMWPAVMSVFLALLLWPMAEAWADGASAPYGYGGSIGEWLQLVMTAPLIGFVPAVLAIPFVPFRRWIVGPEPPFVRAGAVAALVYGPALLVWMGLPPAREWGIFALAEIATVTAIAAYVALARAFRML